MEEIVVNVIPNANELWVGIGGTFDTFTQVACEFIDNSIGNIISNRIFNTNIIITVDIMGNKVIRYTQEDAGTGIKNPEKSLTIGNKDMRESVFNEHGFGMKHAFASANPENNNWTIYTRTKEDMTRGVFKKIKAPYSYEIVCEEMDIKDTTWPGEFNGTGTIISFECNEDFFNTVQAGVSGRAGLKKCLDYFSEDLGYIYSNIIREGKISLTVKSNTIYGEEEEYYNKVGSIEPTIIGYYEPKPNSISLNLGAGDVRIEYKFCEVKEGNFYKYYLKNQATAGAEIRINGRLMLKNVFKDIWGLEMNPHFNHFLALINIVSDDRDKLPKTRTTKNGIRLGDEKLSNLFGWIRKVFPNPPRLSSGAVSEKGLIDELKELKDMHLPNQVKRVDREFSVFTKIGCNVKVDLYVFDGQEVIIYEAKKDDADIQCIYQLRMYWDGCICDGIKPDRGILIASHFSNGVKKVIEQLNDLKDSEGNNYNIAIKTWKEEGIQYPGI
jgi:Predicted nuclease of the RecB family